MDPSYWQQRWRQNDIGFHRDTVNPILEKYITAFDLELCEKVLVPLCGKSLDLRYLLDQGLDVMGVEVSQEAVDAFFNENRIQPRITTVPGSAEIPPPQWYIWHNLSIYCGDFFKFEPAQTFDLVYDRAALIALRPQDRIKYAEKLTQLTRPGSQMLLSVMCHAAEDRQPPFSVSDDEVRDLFANFEIEKLEGVSDKKPPEHLAHRISKLSESVFKCLRK